MADSRPTGPQLRVGELQHLSPMYSTRPCCLVQAGIRAWTQIWVRDTAWLIRPFALCGSMSSIDQQGSSLGSCPTFPSPKSPLWSAIGSLTLCQALSGGRQWQIHSTLSLSLSLSLSLPPSLSFSLKGLNVCCLKKKTVENFKKY